MQSNWIDERYSATKNMKALADKWHKRPYTPLELPNFISPQSFNALNRCVHDIPNFQRDYSILSTDDTVESVPFEDWQMTSPNLRWNSQDVARPLTDLFAPNAFTNPKHRLTLQDFFQFAVLGDELVNWLSRLTGVQLSKRVSCEIVRYQPDDYIVPHKDTHDDRIIGINFYLGPDWQDGFGGELGFENELADQHWVKPRPNTLSVIPIDESCTHWVESWKHDMVGRYTISMSFRPI